MQEFVHVPVLLNEVVSSFELKKGDWFLDATLGGAGHAKEILKKFPCIEKYVGFDQDTAAIAASKQNLKIFNNVEYVHANFRNAPEMQEKNAGKFGGILADIGVSSFQIDEGSRGFSFQKDARLDMRMNGEASLSAWEVVNTYSKERLADIIFHYGEERDSRKIAAAIVKARAEKPIDTTFQLKDVVSKAVFGNPWPAVQRVFQAIRIEVNDELGALEDFVKNAFGLLRKGGRLAIISFHSLEDRIVKNAFQDLSRGCICPPSFPVCVCGHKPEGKLVTKKPIVAGEEEQKRNTRSASAKLRVIEKLT